MSVWKFFSEIALFKMIRRWFSSTQHATVPKPIPVPIPPVIKNQRVATAPAILDQCNVDELHERVDALESELDDLDIMSARYDDIQDRLDQIMDRIDEIEEAEYSYLMEYDYNTDHLLFDDDNY